MKKKQDETEYLMASEANRKALDESIKEPEAGQGIRIALEDLWKEDEEYYISAMETGRKTELLTEAEKQEFLQPLKTK